MTTTHPTQTHPELAVIYAEGNVAHLHSPFTTGWRRMPLHVCGQITQGRWRFEFTDGKRLNIRTGDAFFLPAGLQHKSDKYNRGLTVSRWAHLGVSQGMRGDPLLQLNIPRRFDGIFAARVGELCEALAQVGAADISLKSTARRMSLLYELVAVLAELGESRTATVNVGESSTEPDAPLTRIGPALEIMRQYHFQSLEIESLAASVHLSVPRFRAVFKRATGLPPHQYVQRLRFELAKGLLERGDEPVKVVAQRVGYENPYLFSRLFKRDVGMTPGGYRRQSRSAPSIAAVS